MRASSSSASAAPIPPKAAKRIHRELTDFRTAPPPFVPKMAVDETNMRHLYFLIEGPDDSPFKGGEYVMRVELPNDYPMSAPVLRMLTPSGRFEVDKSICTTFTHFHPESWSPTYNFSNIMVSFVSFMLEPQDPKHHVAVGGMYASEETQREYALTSKEWNKKKGFDARFLE